MGSFIKKTEDSDIISMSEFIDNRLFFVTYKNKIPEDSKTFHYFTANDAYSNDEHSDPISRVSLGTIAQFIKTVNGKLSRRKYTDKVIVNFSTGSERRRSNAAVLMGVYAITQLQMTLEEVVEKLSNHTTISPVDSLKAIKKAIALGFVNFDNFNTEDFYSLDDVKLNWVVPHKFLMFAGPIEASNGRYLSPRRYVAYFRHVGVRTIIRLCHIKYDANPFVDADIPHYDLNISGSIPSDKVLEVFLALSEECRGVVLVHCREFLGRAGCLVGAYLVKHCGMTATEAIAWVRLCTSECILEAQKTWLKGNEAALCKAGGDPLSENSQKSRGICDRPEATDETQEEVTDTPSSADDVTAQLENEVKVVDIVKSDSNVNTIENVA